MHEVFSVSAQDLRVTAHMGANCVLIAMSVDEDKTENLAGFAIFRQREGEAETTLLNRLSFEDPITSATTPQQRKWTPSDRAPFQKFRWIDIPPDGVTKKTTYRVQAMYFTGVGVELRPGAEGSVTVEPSAETHAKFKAAFTRGYISSQAYAERFHNADIRPSGPKTANFDTAPFEAQYKWLGAGARQALFDFLDQCRADKSARIDVFAYDLDEPDVIAAICEFGRETRLRAVLDNASLHTGDAVEVEAARMIIEAAGEDNVVQGHFGRYQHNKVFIERDADGAARRVLFGSMNFSVRGIYVQSNNVIITDDERTAGYFAAAFDNAFANGASAAKFKKDPIAQDYNLISAKDTAELPKSRIALSPHADASVSLGPATKRIQGAKSSVLFAVMEPSGGGDVLASLRAIAAKPTVFSYGTVETAKGLAVQRGDGAMGDVADFAYLKSKVPYPFAEEFDPGPGRHIHDKFVVVDFNDDSPAVLTGSSNLAAGGEQANGDSLIMIEDPGLAAIYAIEALKIFDHYSFRDKMKEATEAAPLTLWRPDRGDQSAPWWRSYYDQKNIKFRDRCLFAGAPLPPGLRSMKAADWSALGAQALKQLDAAATATAQKASAGAKRSAAGASSEKSASAKKPASKAKRASAKPPRKAAVKKTARKAATKKAATKKTARKAAAKKSARKPAAKKTVRKSAAKTKTARTKPTKKTLTKKTAQKKKTVKSAGARRAPSRKAATKRKARKTSRR
jgi:phosphatidylserine/phosphatidylglycerophosphate/cardiolipin synthase-like enzyme